LRIAAPVATGAPVADAAPAFVFSLHVPQLMFVPPRSLSV
jgi:hypothetical protein